MIKAIVFDWDGMIYFEESLFSQKLNRDYEVNQNIYQVTPDIRANCPEKEWVYSYPSLIP